MCSENSALVLGPRISFSLDFGQSGAIPVEKLPLRSNSPGLNSTIDFDFCVRESVDSSTADELFFDGKILPTEIKKKIAPAAAQQSRTEQPSAHPPLPPSRASRETHKKLKPERPKESKTSNNEAEEKQSSRSFWKFKRSNSLGSGYGHTLCPLPLLSRSNSTGSETKQETAFRDRNSQKQNAYKNLPSKSSQSASSSSTGYQKPPLKKGLGPYGAGATAALNLQSRNLFGLGFVFSLGRDKGKKR